MKQNILCGLLIVWAGLLLPSCSDGISTEPDPGNGDDLVQEYASATMTIAWPMGSGENPNNWSGDEGTRTSGDWAATGCGWRYTHSGADVQARDLNRNDGNDYGKAVVAGFDGKVVRARSDGGYGNTVVIYDAGRHVAVRYAHLSSIGVREGQFVRMRDYLGNLGNTGKVTGPHLHVVGYENINDNNGNPIIPNLCDSEFYACTIYFMC